MTFADGLYEPWTCPTCGREVPASFDFCWNCGGDQTGETSLELASDEPASESANADDPGPLYRRMHRRTALALVWAVTGWFAAMVGAAMLIALRGPEGHRPWTITTQLIAAATGFALAVAVGASLALLAFILSPLWENYGPSTVDHGERPEATDPDAATPEALGFRRDRGVGNKRR